MSGAAASGEVFEAYYSIPRLLLALVGALAFVAAALLMANTGLVSGSWLVAGAAVAGIAFFGFVAAIIVRRLFDRRVQIRIDAKGIMVREWSDQVIAHRSIRRASDMGQFVGLFLHKPEKYSTTSPMRRFLLRVGGELQRSAGDIYIVKYQYDRRADAIFDALDRMRPRTAFEEEVERRVANARASS